MRLTVTRPDGREVVRLLSVNLRQKGPCEDILDMALAELADLGDSFGGGQYAQHSLLALLLERLFPHDEMTETATPRKLAATGVSSVAAVNRPRKAVSPRELTGTAATRELAGTGVSSA